MTTGSLTLTVLSLLSDMYLYSVVPQCPGNPAMEFELIAMDTTLLKVE